MTTIWRQTTYRQRGEILCLITNELFRNLCPYERDCLFKIQMQEACREPIDANAKSVIDEAVERHNRKWNLEMEARIRDGSLQAWIRGQHARREKLAAETKKTRWAHRVELDGRIT